MRTLEEVRADIQTQVTRRTEMTTRVAELMEIEASETGLSEEQTTEADSLIEETGTVDAALVALRTEENTLVEAQNQNNRRADRMQTIVSTASNGQGTIVPRGQNLNSPQLPETGRTNQPEGNRTHAGVGRTHGQGQSRLPSGQPGNVDVRVLEPSQRDRMIALGGYLRIMYIATQPECRNQTPQQIAESSGRHDVIRMMNEGANYAHQFGAPPASGLDSATATGGSEWVPPNYVADIIELLRPRAVVRSMGAMEVPLVNGSMTLPKIAAGASASYTAENANIPPSDMQSGEVVLNGKELVALVPVSNRLIRVSDPRADQIIVNDLVRVMAQTEDFYFIRGAAGGNSPTGLRFQTGITVLTAAAGVTFDVVDQQLGRLELALMEANVDMGNPGYIMAPRTKVFLEKLRDGNGNRIYPELQQGRLNNWPIACTTQIPINLGGGTETEIYFVDFNHVLIGDNSGYGLGMQISDVAAYHDGANVVAAFSKNQTVVRTVAENDLALRHAQAVAVLDGVTWGA